MTACVDIDSNGYLIANGQTADNCQSYVLVSAPHYEILVEPVLDADSIAYVFGWGFGAVVVIGYFGSFAVGVAKSVINKL